ncbi:hypothetical protein LY622_21195 [Halomonas sp. M5N1S17]|uniref:hypothetical protein n=1 Tax=Halomonas alkalisoli TaxID=2907158 RepID=UPI001F18A475|nr:hypothetical protein [Halomonas alkalisoli]MCE9665950.1 hypothetical protein [Halomonas alkalisoli]
MRRMKTLCLWWLILAFATPLVALANAYDQLDSGHRFIHEHASEEVRAIVSWVTHSEDNLGMPFMIVDKREARVFMFDATGQLSGEASALLGMAVGDDSVPGIGERALANIRPDERTTPAGRFVASLGRNLKGGEILWVDYETAISLHPVVAGTPRERRAERLATPYAHDKRITYGCINVPKTFYTTVVSPAFKHSNGIVYVLPETRSKHAVFESYYDLK